MADSGDQGTLKVPQPFGLAVMLLLAALAAGAGDATLPTIAQTPDTNPPSREECRKLAADAEVRTLDAEEKNRLSLCLATHRDQPGPAPGEPEAGPLGKERQG